MLLFSHLSPLLDEYPKEKSLKDLRLLLFGLISSPDQEKMKQLPLLKLYLYKTASLLIYYVFMFFILSISPNLNSIF